MHDPPPVQLVERQIARVVEGEEEEDGDAPKADQQDRRDRRLAAAQNGRAHVVEEQQRRDDDGDLDVNRLFQKLATLVDAEQVTDDGHGGGDDENPELQLGDERALDVSFRLFRDEVISRAEKAQQ